MKKSLKNLCLLSFAMGFLLWSCQENKTAFVNPPVPEWNLKPIIFEFDAENGGVFHTLTGSTITVPANALTDADGNKITGKVALHYREFHDGLDSWLSGIPMQYDSGATNNTFQTAGMFDINAFQEEKVLLSGVSQSESKSIKRPLKIAKEAKIKVDMASYDAAPDFSAYTLDTVSRNWTFNNASQALPNTYKKERLDSLEEKKKVFSKKASQSSNRFVFNYYSMLDVYYGEGAKVVNNWNAIVRKKAFTNRKNKTVRKQLESYEIKWANITVNDWFKYKNNFTNANLLVWEVVGGGKLPRWCFDNTNFNKAAENEYEHIKRETAFANSYLYTRKDSIFETKTLTNKRTKKTKKERVFKEIRTQTYWQSAKTTFEDQKNGTYLLSMTEPSQDGNGKITQLRIKPIMAIKDLLKVDEKQLRNRYGGAVWDSLVAEQKRIQFMADVTRSFQVDGFGIYNYDKFWYSPEKVVVKADFTLDGKTLSASSANIVMIPKGSNAFVNIAQYAWKDLAIVPDNEMKTFAILSKGKVAIYSTEKYAQIPFEELRKKEGQEFTFDMNLLQVVVNSPSELRQVLGLTPSKSEGVVQ